MKAAQLKAYGGVSAVSVEEIDMPVPGEGQVLVEVYAASLNPFDTTIREGYMKDMIPLKLPVTIGGDIAGKIVAVGEGVKSFNEGDSVFGQANVVAGNSGAFAEFTATAAEQVAKTPIGLNYKEAAALPLVGVSAWQAVTQTIHLKPGQKIFIHGGGGGIGRVAIQLAKHIGAYVATTATGDNVNVVRGLGADEVINYKTQDFTELLSDYDAVFDTVGGDDFVKTLDVLKSGGVAVSMIAPPDEAKAAKLGVAASMQQTRVTTAALNELRKLVEKGVVKPYIGEVFALEDVQEAFAARESGVVSGKIVLEIKK